MTLISRNPCAAARQAYDLIIVGGGIYGAMLSWAAVSRGLKPLLLERDDFGGATSLNSLRIIHGGFRYLQQLDLPRYFESVRARQWFLQHFPHLVRPLPCLMPLYNQGMRTPTVLRAALSLNDLLSSNRNQNICQHNHLPPGQVITAEQVKQAFPLVQTQGLKGGAIWYDASLESPQRLLIGLLRRSCALGGVALNYVEAQELLRVEHDVAGVMGKDVIGGESYEYQAKVVINAAGPWCREFAARQDRDIPALFNSSLAWNILFECKAPSNFAVAVTPPKTVAKTYFLRPLSGKLFAGTVHSAWSQGILRNPLPCEAQVTAFIQDLNAAVPGLGLDLNQIQQIYSGFLPATRESSVCLARREVIWNHADNHEIQGFYSISGIKLTTSPLVAQETIAKIFPEKKLLVQNTVLNSDYPDRIGLFDNNCRLDTNNSAWEADLRQIIHEESVQHLDDLVLRRTNFGDNPKIALNIADRIACLFSWNERLRQQEILRLNQAMQKFKYL
jgi:glycerol-3-phosphate dehydrogenase